jgi:D-glycero-alpha-D-manno-heptose-7-phosphate kinase
LSATVNRYASASIVSGDQRVAVRSIDYDATITYGIDDPFVYDGQLDLVKGVLEHFRKEHGLRNGVEVLLHNDAPPGSGLGSSSAITVALMSAIACHLRVALDAYQMADVAYRIERVDCGIKGGKQDQYACTFGGFNFIEFHCDGTTVVTPLRLSPETVDELEYSLVFAYVGGGHFSSHIINQQVDNVERCNRRAIDAMDRLKDLTSQMKRALLLGKLSEFGELLHLAWENKKQMADGITTPSIDDLYDHARRAGALGGKMSGAGGGGFMFFACDPHKRFAVQKALVAHGAQLMHFSFVQHGVRAWQVR